MRAGEIEYETGEPALGNVVTVEETAPHAYKGAFVTDLAVGSVARAALLCDWGRRRWNIENGFHTLKGRALRCESLSAEALEALVGARRMRFARE